jgi:hypothetical protein
MILNYEFLIKFCSENNIQLFGDYENIKINAFTILEGKCINDECLDAFKKEFRSLVKTNGYCFECTKNNAKNKLKQTWLNKYGIEHISKLDYIKDKIKQTNLKKYGVECSLLNNEVKEKTKKTNLKNSLDPNKLKETKEKFKNTCLERYGVEHTSQLKETKEKIKNNCLQRYGVEHTSQLKETKEKCKQTNMEKYGVDSYSKTDIFKDNHKKICLDKFGVTSSLQTDYAKDRLKITSIEKYGVDHPSKSKEFKEKYKKTCLEKYGHDHPSKSKEFKEKYKNTCLEKYGVENSSQSPEIMEKIKKTAYNLKDYIFPSGRIEKVQGYEHFALNDLIKNENVDENDIVVGIKNVPEIWYNDIKTKKRRHFVDIFIPPQNRCVEVKSTYTKKINLQNVFLKQEAAKNLGYKYELWVYNNKGNKLETHY